MKLPNAVSLLALLLGLVPLRAEDYLHEAQDENSPLVQTTSDHRIKFTLLYVGPVTDKQIHDPFVVVYMREDCRSDEDLAQHHAVRTADNAAIDTEFALLTKLPEVRGSAGRLKDYGSERARGYDGVETPAFKETYPQLKLPAPDHPGHLERVSILEYFFKSVPTGPFDITLHDNIGAYGESGVHFHDIDTSSFSN